MKATRQEIILLDGFLDELDWFIGESKRNKALRKVRDLIVETIETNGWNRAGQQPRMINLESRVFR